jgi:hypothetical protein
MSVKTPRPAYADAIASTEYASPVSACNETYFKLHNPLHYVPRFVLFASSSAARFRDIWW